MQSLYEPVTVNAEHMAAAKAESLMRDHREGGHMRRCEVRRPAGCEGTEYDLMSRETGSIKADCPQSLAEGLFCVIFSAAYGVAVFLF